MSRRRDRGPAGAITELADFVDAVKPSFVDETAPASPFIGQRWVQPSTLSLSMWDGSEWVEIASGLPSVLDESGLSLTPSNTTYALGAPNIVGVAFTAPRSGIVRVDFAARMQHDFNLLFVCPRIRTGATVGSGTNVFSPNDDDAILLRNGTVRTGSFITPGGLTPGGSYNAALEHRVNAGTALELSARKIMVTPHKKGS